MQGFAVYKMAILQQRPIKGARISTFYPVKALPPLASLDSAFQLQEYISLLIRLDVHDVERIVSIPGRHGGKEREGSDDMRGENRDPDRDGKGDVAVDQACWIYEHLRCVCGQVPNSGTFVFTSSSTQTLGARFVAPAHNHIAARMHAPDVSRDESG